jgi:uncharacterized membrane protein YphA (DoxX/SURF4 family)
MYMFVLFVIGRILLGGYFVYNAYSHFANIQGLAGYAAMKKVPAAKAAVITGGVMLGLGGLAILSNKFAILGMCLVVLFLIPTTIMMHAFWKEADPQARMMERIQFAKNVGLIGALILLISIG